MNRLKVFLSARRFRYPALCAGAVVLLVAGMLIASSAGFATHVYASPRSVAAAGGAPASFADLAEALGPSVVNVKITKLEKTQFPNMPQMGEGPFGDMFKQFFGDMPRQPHQFKSHGAGSGVIIDGDGTILTNNHVVDGAQEITVTLSDKREYKARVVGRDPKTDLAVIRIEGKGRFPAAKLGDSEGASRRRVGPCGRQSLRPQQHGHLRHRERERQDHRRRPLRRFHSDGCAYQSGKLRRSPFQYERRGGGHCHGYHTRTARG